MPKGPIVIRYADKSEAPVESTAIDFFSNPREMVLYGKPSGTSMSHELSHLRLGHMDVPENFEDTPELYADEEIDAWVDTYRRLGRPKHLTRRLRGYVKQLVQGFGISSSMAIALLDRRLSEEDVPRIWLNDWKKVKKESLNVLSGLTRT